MSYIIDLIIIAICILPIIIFAKKGFVYALVKVVGFVAAFILATGIGNFLSDIVYNKVIEPKVVSTVMENVDNGVSSIADATWEALPEFIRENGEAIGISKDSFVSSPLSGLVAEEDVTALLSTTVKPVILNLLSTLIKLIAFVVLLIIVGFLSKILNKLFSFSIIGKLNKTLGGIIGIPIGILFSYVFCLLMELTLSLTSKGLWIFTSNAVNSSKLYNLLMSIF